MAEHMRRLRKPIGHRLGHAIKAYAANYPEENERRNINDALADQVEMRLLPKLRGVEMENAESHLSDLAEYVENNLKDAVLSEAIKESINVANDGAGQFVWLGVTR